MVCGAEYCKGQISESTTSLNLDSKMENDVDCKIKDTYRRNKRCKRTHQDGTVVLGLGKSRGHASKWRRLLAECYGWQNAMTLFGIQKGYSSSAR